MSIWLVRTGGGDVLGWLNRNRMTLYGNNQNNTPPRPDRGRHLGAQELEEAALARLAGDNYDQTLDDAFERRVFDDWIRWVGTEAEVAQRDRRLADARQAIERAEATGRRSEIGAAEATYRTAFWQRPEAASRLPADEWEHHRPSSFLDERAAAALDGYPAPGKKADRARDHGVGPDRSGVESAVTETRSTEKDCGRATAEVERPRVAGPEIGM